MSDLSLRRASGAQFVTIETAKRLSEASIRAFSSQLNPALEAQFRTIWQGIETLIVTNNALAARVDALEARQWHRRVRRWLARAKAWVRRKRTPAVAAPPDPAPETTS